MYSSSWRQRERSVRRQRIPRREAEQRRTCRTQPSSLFLRFAAWKPFAPSSQRERSVRRQRIPRREAEQRRTCCTQPSSLFLRFAAWETVRSVEPAGTERTEAMDPTQRSGVTENVSYTTF